MSDFRDQSLLPHLLLILEYSLRLGLQSLPKESKRPEEVGDGNFHSGLQRLKRLKRASVLRLLGGKELGERLARNT